MAPHRRTRVKVCCIADVGEAELAVRCGADAVGLVAAMPSGPGPIPVSYRLCRPACREPS